MLYRLYGESVASDLDLTSRLPATAGDEASLHIALATIPSDVTYQRRLPGVARFGLDSNHIYVETLPQAEPPDVVAGVLGAGLSLWLRRYRGYLCLHASSVEVHGHALLFAGPSGHGKSTIAHALVEHGHQLLADDLTAIDTSAGAVVPAYPEVRLWPDSHAAVNQQFASRPLRPEIAKRSVGVSERFQRSPVPLSAIFLIEPGTSVNLERAGTAAAMFGLLQNTWELQLLSDPEEDAELHLSQVTAIASSVPIWRLQRTADFDDLRRMIDAIRDAVGFDLR